MKRAAIKVQNMWMARPKRNWLPSDLPPKAKLYFWFRSKDIQSFSVGTNVVGTLSNASIGADFVQATAGEKPDIATSSDFVGLKVLDFNQGDQRMQTPSPSDDDLDIGTGDFFIAAALKHDAGGGMTFLSVQRNSNSSEIRVDATGGGAYRVRSGTNAVTDTETSDDVVRILVAQRLAGTVSLFVDGESVGTPVASTTDIDSDNPATLGALTNTGFFDGQIAEFLGGFSTASGGIITEFERQQIEGYLAHEVKITSVLPDDHPYKNVRPKI